MDRRNEAVIIGGGVADISVRPVTEEVFHSDSTPADDIAMQPGGDAVNEAIALSRLGHGAALVTKFGRDPVGDLLVGTLRENGVDTAGIRREADLATSVNIVLVSPDGERRFITSRRSSLRRLTLSDILPALDSPLVRGARVACLASLFVSPMLPLSDTKALFERLKGMGLILCADTSRPKNGETADDLTPLLPYLDYFFPNLPEAEALTGAKGPEAAAEAFIARGLRHIAVKTGGDGCFIAGEGLRAAIPAWPDARCVDTTGAGDTFAAGFIAALLEGRDFVDCARFANAAASVCVEGVGAGALRDRGEADRRFARMRAAKSR